MDICSWCEVTPASTVMKYEFYRKPMANPVMTPANSALSPAIKMSTHRQEVYRILSNTSHSHPWTIKAKLLSECAHRMMLSGYGVGFRVLAINGGIKAFMKCWLNQQIKGIPIHRPRNFPRVLNETEIIGFSLKEAANILL